MRQRYHDNVKREKPKENQLGIIKIYTFCQEIQQKTSGPGESTGGVTYLCMRIHPKNCCIFPLKFLSQLYLVVQGRAQLDHSSHIV